MYLSTTIRKLPDLFARQTTVRYQETPMYLEFGSEGNYQPLHVTDTWTTNVRYRNGFDVAEVKPPKLKRNEPALITYGVFGPALMGVLDMINHHVGISWSHWEQGSQGLLAVFRYAVPTDESLHRVWSCCVPDGDGTGAFERYAGYHEEIAINPDTGAILRTEFEADLKSTTPLSRSDIMIEYGPVEIGDKSYICPVRSITIARGRSIQVIGEWGEPFRTYGPYISMLNDITFDRYHIFRSDSHVLPDFVPTEK